MKNSASIIAIAIILSLLGQHFARAQQPLHPIPHPTLPHPFVPHPQPPAPPTSQPPTVLGAIADKYNQLGGANGLLGPVTTNEQPAPFGGRFNEFAHGVIYWHPNTGAHEVHGAILALWT